MAKKKSIEVVSYSNKPQDDSGKKLLSAIVAMIMIGMLFSAAVYFFFLAEPVIEDSGSDDDLKAVIYLDPTFGYQGVAGPEFRAWVGQPFSLTANQSTGSIHTYSWDMDGSVDRDGDGNPGNDADKVGETIQHTYGRPDVYTIRLWVFNADRSESSRARATIRVSQKQMDLQGSTSSPNSLTDNFNTFIVPPDPEGYNTITQRIFVNLTYPIGSSPQNTLEMNIRNGEGNIIMNGDVTYENTTTKTIHWSLSAQWITAEAPGEWRVDIVQTAPLVQPRTIYFELEIMVLLW
ncbi:MAG: PKD domain-containing protein [Candidatus Thermoplasmatota archaeon]|nr:PKD domain-containing protein [Candidatus Thermoplasmatota archaeon]